MEVQSYVRQLYAFLSLPGYQLFHLPKFSRVKASIGNVHLSDRSAIVFLKLECLIFGSSMETITGRTHCESQKKTAFLNPSVLTLNFRATLIAFKSSPNLCDIFHWSKNRRVVSSCPFDARGPGFPLPPPPPPSFSSSFSSSQFRVQGLRPRRVSEICVKMLSVFKRTGYYVLQSCISNFDSDVSQKLRIFRRSLLITSPISVYIFNEAFCVAFKCVLRLTKIFQLKKYLEGFI